MLRNCVSVVRVRKEFLRIRIFKNVIFWTWLTQNSLNLKSMMKISVSVTLVRSRLSGSNCKDLFKQWCLYLAVTGYVLSEVIFLSDKIVFFCKKC